MHMSVKEHNLRGENGQRRKYFCLVSYCISVLLKCFHDCYSNIQTKHCQVHVQERAISVFYLREINIFSNIFQLFFHTFNIHTVSWHRSNLIPTVATSLSAFYISGISSCSRVFGFHLVFPLQSTYRAISFRCYIFHLGAFWKATLHMKVPSITALPFKVPQLDTLGSVLEENVHNCVLLGWSLYFYSHKNCFIKAANRGSIAHLQLQNAK